MGGGGSQAGLGESGAPNTYSNSNPGFLVDTQMGWTLALERELAGSTYNSSEAEDGHAAHAQQTDCPRDDGGSVISK